MRLDAKRTRTAISNDRMVYTAIRIPHEWNKQDIFLIIMLCVRWPVKNNGGRRCRTQRAWLSRDTPRLGIPGLQRRVLLRNKNKEYVFSVLWRRQRMRVHWKLNCQRYDEIRANFALRFNKAVPTGYKITEINN